MSGTRKQDEALLSQLKSCQQELQLLKMKLLENSERIERNETWQKTIEKFLNSQLGFDVQRAMKLSSSPSISHNLVTGFDRSPTVGDIVSSGRYRKSFSPSTSLGIVPSNLQISKSKSDDLTLPSIPSHSSSQLSSSLNLAQINSKNKQRDKVFTTTRSKYSSYSATTGSEQQDTIGSSALTGNKRKFSSEDLVSTPTFPLSDTQCGGNLTGDSSPTDNDQDTESENRRFSDGFSEVKFQEIEDKIREIIPIGSGKSVRQYQCLVCGKTLTQRQNARLHIRRVHFLERLKCSGCGRGFYDRRCLSNHKALCGKYAEIKDKEFRPSLSSCPIPIDSMQVANYGQLRSSSSLSDDSQLMGDDSENDQDTSAGNSWMEKSSHSAMESGTSLIINKDEESRHPVTFIISDDNLTMRKESNPSGQQQHAGSKEEEDQPDLDPSGNGDGSSSDLFYAPGKLVVVEIVPEMFHFDS